MKGGDPGADRRPGGAPGRSAWRIGLLLLILAARAAASAPAAAQTVPGDDDWDRWVLEKEDLSDVADRTVYLIRLRVQPPGVSSLHSHPGHEFVYVTRGRAELAWQDGSPPTGLGPGESCYVRPGREHVDRVLGAEPLEMIVFLVHGTGRPLTVTAPGELPREAGGNPAAPGP